MKSAVQLCITNFIASSNVNTADSNALCWTSPKGKLRQGNGTSAAAKIQDMKKKKKEREREGCNCSGALHTKRATVYTFSPTCSPQVLHSPTTCCTQEIARTHARTQKCLTSTFPNGPHLHSDEETPNALCSVHLRKYKHRECTLNAGERPTSHFSIVSVAAEL